MPDPVESLDAVRASSVPAFRFIIKHGNAPLGVFTECTLPTIEWELEEVKEGGRNDFVHQLPGRRKLARLTLKNGVGKTSLSDWFWQMMEGTVERKTLTIELRNAKDNRSGEPVMRMTIMGAYPIKWTGPQLKADDNSIAVQSVEFACGQIVRDKVSGEAAN